MTDDRLDWLPGNVIETTGEGETTALEIATAYHPQTEAWVVLIRIGPSVIPLTPDQADSIIRGLRDCVGHARAQAGLVRGRS